MEELPWVKSVERFRDESRSTREVSRQVLCEVLVTTLTAFPYAMLPNKLLQEIRALAKGAAIEVTVLDELAADIFMGDFSPKFVQAAKRAGELLDGSIYARYYQIDYRRIAELKEEKPKRRGWALWGKQPDATTFASLCAGRAGVELGGWDPAANGMVIEQQQIITTQNLAPLVMSLGMQDQLGPHLIPMARSCFGWIIRRMEAGDTDWHAKLIAVKNSAYAWRQMMFFV